ncbi:MAG: flagellar export chaperone FliS [Paenibacillaceae bacterium]
MINQQSLLQNQQRNKYLQTSIQTATPSQLLIMLFDGAIRFCKGGIDAIKNSDLEEANRCICRAEDIIMEFVVTLDKTSSIAEGLIQMYDYMYFRLIEANTKKEVEPIEEVIGFLTEMKETWVQAARQLNGAPQPGVVNG